MSPEHELRGGDGAPTPEGPPPLPRRLLDAFVSPGKMTEDVAAHPRWLGALLTCVALIAFATWLIPPELFAEAQRRAAFERGVDVPRLTAETLRTMHSLAVFGGAIAFTLISLFLSGVYAIIFAFVLGDEGRYTQYLAVLAHAAFIPALLSVPLAPLRIATGDAQFSLNLASFALFVPDGYFSNVLRMMDLTQIWSTLVVARGVHAIDTRRSFGSAAVVLLGILLAIALIIARFIPA